MPQAIHLSVFVISISAWFWWSGLTYIHLASARVAEDYQQPLSTATDDDFISPFGPFDWNRPEALPLHIVFLRLLVTLAVCLTPNFGLIDDKEGFIFRAAMFWGLFWLFARFGLGLSLAGFSYGWSIFSSESTGLSWCLELIVKLIALVAGGFGVVACWCLGMLALLVGYLGNELTVLLAEGLTWTGMSAFASTAIATLPICLVSLAIVVGNDQESLYGR